MQDAIAAAKKAMAKRPKFKSASEFEILEATCCLSYLGESPEAPAGKRDKLASVQDAIAAAKEVMAKTDLSMAPGSASPTDKLPPESDPSVTGDADQDAERRRSNATASPSGGASEGATKDGEGSIREYRNDLEYLEDSFKLLIILLKYVSFSPLHF